MDYSLLVGISEDTIESRNSMHLTFNKNAKLYQQYKGGIASENENGEPFYNEIYYIGIIDILINYDLFKMSEYSLKSVLHPISYVKKKNFFC